MQIRVPSTFAAPLELLIFTFSILTWKQKKAIAKLKKGVSAEIEIMIRQSKLSLYIYLRKTAMRNVKLGITLLKAVATVGEVYAKPA